MSIKKEDNTCIGQRSNEGRDKKGTSPNKKEPGNDDITMNIYGKT